MCSSSCWACYAWFGVYFIIEAPIRGKPSCARPRGPKASHQRKLLTAVKFWISDFWGANWYLYCPLGPVPRLTSSPQPRWRICQITLLGDMSAAGLRWWLGAELSVTEFGNGTTDPPPFHRSRCSGNSWREGKRGRLLLPLQLRAHSKEEAEGLVARPASQWAHARKPKAWPPELESRSQDSRRGAPVTRAEPQSEAVLASRPFQSGLHLCSCHLS